MPNFPADDLAAWTGGTWRNGRPATVTGVSIDTRTLQPGQLYVALRGERVDGHAFVEQAMARGATAAVVETECAVPLPLLNVKGTRAALLAMARGHRNRLPTRIVLVTGSVGKTTVKELAADVLSMSGPTARTRGNFNNDIGLPLSLLAVEESARYGVFEVGMNHAGELAPLAELLRPEVGIITAIGPVHIEHFPSVEAIAVEKASVLPWVQTEGFSILQADDEWFDVLKRHAPGEVVTVSTARDADYVAERRTSDHFVVRERRSGQQTDFIAPLPGDYFVRNALLAIALGRRFGLAWASIVEAIKNYRPIHLRWQRERVRGIEVVNDAYNANPVSMRASIEAFEEMPCAGRRWLVLGGMRELGSHERAEHEALGRRIAAGAWEGLITVGPLGNLIARGAAGAGFDGSVIPCVTHAEAASVIARELESGDAMLLKGSRGERMEEVLAEWEKLNQKETAHHE